MSIVGSSPGIGSGQVLEIGALRGLGAASAPLPQPAPARDAAPAPPPVAASPAAAGPVVTSMAQDAGPVPIDQARVASIKKAIETNSFPLVPARIGDAMIAAGMVLRMPR